MAAQTQLFAGTHAEAVERADALDTGTTPNASAHAEVPALSPVDLEVLGEIAAKAVRFGSGDLEVAEVDLEHESLYRLPPFLCEVLAELGQVDPSGEDGDVQAEVARQWAASEEMFSPGEDLRPLLASVLDLVAAAQRVHQDVYLWVAEG